MNFCFPAPVELSELRRDPLLWEQELDARPELAKALEQALSRRSGESYWRSAHDHLYGLELADLGQGRPSMARVFGYWDRYEPRPPEHEIDADLFAFCVWMAEIAPGMDPADVRTVAERAGVPTGWPQGAILQAPLAGWEGLGDFHATPRHTVIEGLRIVWVEQGTGETVILLHGDAAWGYQHRHLLRLLAPRFNVVVPDLPGFGRSDRPIAANAFTLRSLGRWLRKFVLALGRHKVTLVAQDLAALPAVRVAAQLPGQVARVALQPAVAGLHRSTILAVAPRRAANPAAPSLAATARSPGPAGTGLHRGCRLPRPLSDGGPFALCPALSYTLALAAGRAGRRAPAACPGGPVGTLPAPSPAPWAGTAHRGAGPRLRLGHAVGARRWGQPRGTGAAGAGFGPHILAEPLLKQQARLLLNSPMTAQPRDSKRVLPGHRTKALNEGRRPAERR